MHANCYGQQLIRKEIEYIYIYIYLFIYLFIYSHKLLCKTKHTQSEMGFSTILSKFKNKNIKQSSNFSGVIHILCHQHDTTLKQVANKKMNVLLHKSQIVISWLIFVT
jgi:hypothetical protein